MILKCELRTNKRWPILFRGGGGGGGGGGGAKMGTRRTTL